MPTEQEIQCTINDEQKIICIIEDKEIIRVEISESGSGINAGSLGGILVKEDLTNQVTLGKKVFTFSNKYVSGSILVFINGLKERIINELAGNLTIELTVGLELDDSIEVEYIRDES
jgi:hypothetical protein